MGVTCFCAYRFGQEGILTVVYTKQVLLKGHPISSCPEDPLIDARPGLGAPTHTTTPGDQ